METLFQAFPWGLVSFSLCERMEIGTNEKNGGRGEGRGKRGVSSLSLSSSHNSALVPISARPKSEKRTNLQRKLAAQAPIGQVNCESSISLVYLHVK